MARASQRKVGGLGERRHIRAGGKREQHGNSKKELRLKAQGEQMLGGSSNRVEARVTRWK